MARFFAASLPATTCRRAASTLLAATSPALTCGSLASDSADMVEVKSSQIIIAYKRGTPTIFAADLTHKISMASGEPRLVEKVIRLIDSTDALSAIGFLL